MKQPTFRRRDTPPAKAIAEFAAGADEPKQEQTPDEPKPEASPDLDKNAPRTRRTQYTFNEYEHAQVKAAAQKTGRSMLSFMRFAVMQEASRVLGDEE